MESRKFTITFALLMGIIVSETRATENPSREELLSVAESAKVALLNSGPANEGPFPILSGDSRARLAEWRVDAGSVYFTDDDVASENPEPYRNCAGFDRNAGIFVSRSCWVDLGSRERFRLLRHEILGWLGVPDRDFRVSAILETIDAGLESEGLKEIRSDGGVFGIPYSERLTGKGLFAASEGASGARGGGDPLALSVKAALFETAIATERAYTEKHGMSPDVTRQFWRLLISVDVVAPSPTPYFFADVGSRTIRLQEGVKFEDASEAVLSPNDSVKFLTLFLVSDSTDDRDYLLRLTDPQGEFCERVVARIWTIAERTAGL